MTHFGNTYFLKTYFVAAMIINDSNYCMFVVYNTLIFYYICIDILTLIYSSWLQIVFSQLREGGIEIIQEE